MYGCAVFIFAEFIYIFGKRAGNHEISDARRDIHDAVHVHISVGIFRPRLFRIRENRATVHQILNNSLAYLDGADPDTLSVRFVWGDGAKNGEGNNPVRRF